MATQHLTQSYIKNLTCPSSQSKVSIFDTGCKNLVLEVSKKGKKSYYFRYLDDRGKTRQPKLADANHITLSQARALSNKYRAMLTLGENPFIAKHERKSTPTIAYLVEHHYMPHIITNKRSWKTDESLLRNHILPRFGRLYVDEFKSQHLAKLVSDYKDKYAAGTINRLIILMRYLFNLALEWQITGVNHNPTKDVPLLEDHNGRERYLTEAETQRLLYHIQQSENKQLPAIITMLLLTGARKREVLNARWEDLDFDSRQWRIPITKSGKPRHVPISDGVLSLLQSLPKIVDCPWVFANPKTKKPFVSFYCSWNTARKAAGLADFRVHDLRHSFASFLVNHGTSLYEVQKLLGHTQIKTTQRYSHLSADTLLDASNHVAQLVHNMRHHV